MNKTLILSLSILCLISITACNSSKNEKVLSMDCGSIYAGRGDIRVLDSDFIPVFDTSITGNMYYYESDYSETQLSDIENTFVDTFKYLHALSDRHYDYFDYRNSDDGEKINNVKTINDYCGDSDGITVDPYLFDMLKTAYEFSLASDGKFNIFLGRLSDIYERKFDTLSSSSSALDAELSYTTGLVFSSFSEEEKNKIDSIMKTTPMNRGDMEGLLEFDEATHRIIFNEFKGNQIEISLGGMAKGYATEYIADTLEEKYPGICLLINSGMSSIKAIGTRPDKKKWRIRYTNPAYAEKAVSDNNPYYQNEVAITSDGGFNLSTSGFYEQYFYSFNRDSKDITRYSHILSETGYSKQFFDQVTVYLDDSGLADMYSTALFNTESVDEALSLFKKLNQDYEIDDAELVLCHKENDKGHFTPSLSDITPLSNNGLPIARLAKDASRYEGDYTDIKASDISESLSEYNPVFKEKYTISSGLKGNVSLLTENDKSKTKLAEISYCEI